MKVGHNNFGPTQIGQHIVGHQLAAGVVAIGVVRIQHPQAIPNGNAGGDNEKAPREATAAGMAHGIDGLPGDDHGHHHCFARPRGQLQGHAQQLRIGLLIGVLDVVEESLTTSAQGGRYFSNPDCGFDCFNLAEEGAYSLKLMVPPMLQQSGSLRCNSPILRVW